MRLIHPLVHQCLAVVRCGTTDFSLRPCWQHLLRLVCMSLWYDNQKDLWPKIGKSFFVLASIKKIFRYDSILRCLSIWLLFSWTLFFFFSLFSSKHNSPFLHSLSVLAATFVGCSISGAAMNPARAFGPALISDTWENHWVYWVMKKYIYFLNMIVCWLKYMFEFCYRILTLLTSFIVFVFHFVLSPFFSIPLKGGAHFRCLFSSSCLKSDNKRFPKKWSLGFTSWA